MPRKDWGLKVSVDKDLTRLEIRIDGRTSTHRISSEHFDLGHGHGVTYHFAEVPFRKGREKTRTVRCQTARGDIDRLHRNTMRNVSNMLLSGHVIDCFSDYE